MRKLGVRALNALLFALCCFEVAQIVTRVTTEGLQGEAPAGAGEAAAAESPAPVGFDARLPIVERNLFGSRLGGGELLEIQDDLEPMEETKLPLTLLATIAGESKVARAAIYDGSSRESVVVVPGDQLGAHPDVRVSRIERGRVLLRNQGRNEVLLLAEDTSQVPGAPAVAAPGPRNVSRRPSRVRPPARAARSRVVRPAPRATPRAVPAPQPPLQAEEDAGPEADEFARMEELRDAVSSGEMSIEDVAAELQDLREQHMNELDDGPLPDEPDFDPGADPGLDPELDEPY